MVALSAPRYSDIGHARPAWVDSSLYPFESRWVTIGGADVHYVDEGRGMTLLFLHAAPAWSFIFREFIRDLSRDYRCIAVDFPGFGLSPAPADCSGRLEENARFLAEFMNTLDLDKVVLVVHDTSGAIGVHVAAEDPGRIAGLVLTDTVLCSVSRHPIVGTMLRIVGSALFGFFDDRMGIIVNSTVRMGPVQRQMTASEGHAYTGAFASRSARRRVRAMLTGLVREKEFMRGVEAGLQAVAHLPALVIFGEKDPIRRLGFDKKVASRFRNVESAVIAGEKHFPHEGAPGDMIKVIRDWLRRLPRVGP
jgi:haloalkane dehalogenase